MSSERHVEDLLPAYALGSLDAEELRTTRAHLEACATCRAGLAKYEEVVGALGLATPAAEPAPALKRRVLASLKPRPSPGPGRLAAWLKELWSVPKVAPIWAAAGALALAFLALFNVLLWQRIQRLETQPERLGSKVVTLSATQSALAARGVILFSSGESFGALVVEDLPPLEPERQYQLWLIRDGARISGGVFSVSPQGYGTLLVSAPLPLESYQAFGVTIEPAGGSPGPTGPKVLGGKI